ncbi:RNA pyrophosphohydrolase [Roseibacillus persicicus]|uniref:RNA pyrophosphohydrolase n=1 Tax=Roseibacillus persicicus TaxID=454148 RepID=A0A918TU28_9BACT|nr:RNA pyrophosphohydrolase [Roseibacillus persicicus]GHC63502.1 RNA pyrophosphohydrolase [Roseibacillus persicicus]
MSRKESQSSLSPVLEYRPNVAILLVREDGRLLICERLKVKGAWQFPQGGVDEGETLEEALKREVEEEIGLLPTSYDIIEMKGGYRYVYPPAIKKKKRRKGWFDGQEQTYFRCYLHDSKAKIDIERKPREFRSVKWIEPEDFKLRWLPDFKREVYRRVMKDFFEVELA